MGTQEVNVTIDMEEGDVLGATPSENLVITRIQPYTLADGKLQEGDKICKVNNNVPRDVSHFYKLVVAASRHGHLYLVVHRDQKAKAEIKDSKSNVPPERIGNLRLRDGFHYKLVMAEFQRGEKIGLGIKDYMNCVVVTKCPEGTMAGRVFKVGDQICDVDGVRVTDKGVAQNLFVAAIRANQRVSMVVASPESDEARKWVEESLSTRPVEQQPPQPAQQPAMQAVQTSEKPSIRASAIISQEPPSIRLKSDVRRIAVQEIERRRTTQDAPLPSIIRGSSNTKESKRVTFNNKLTTEHLIVNENPNAPLRTVK